MKQGIIIPKSLQEKSTSLHTLPWAWTCKHTLLSDVFELSNPKCNSLMRKVNLWYHYVREIAKDKEKGVSFLENLDT